MELISDEGLEKDMEGLGCKWRPYVSNFCIIILIDVILIKQGVILIAIKREIILKP